MNQKAKYRTKQHRLLIEYLQTVPGMHITANDVCAYFEERGAGISKATIYRQLEGLVDEGIINKYIVDGSSPACFEYVGAHAHADKDICFHCKCEKCGKLIHLHCDELEEIQAHLYEKHRFKMDPVRTVFYGLCEQCI
ncbi:MAG: transcriptional repressor [Lachnospiraceae bacterium]|nr:transcriptional repressor [Lachnospiraceae bacterium]